MTEAAQRKAAGWPKLLRDTDGLIVRTKREMRNGWAVIPAGMIGEIEGGPSWEAMQFKSTACACCHVRVRIGRTSWRDYEVVR